ncbi:VPLPA-CTERM sorting domain-containing protein [Oceanicoccus sp. KOV_DT_Chl]|uniref:VPLPA-CTERM sorting domain-containing protein n=1 Tax=Oceanicoccus sp. KOV_DT_Chl TaxID=1904639 RepID=UPI000C7AC1F1|nr:VPLPA-CTERM sorting domain-containing protein [Oceanicoccus sp. KOV_DT_Chl]
MPLKFYALCALCLSIALPSQAAFLDITVQSKTVVNGTVNGSYISNVQNLKNGYYDDVQKTFSWNSSVHRINYLTGYDWLAEDVILQSSFTMRFEGSGNAIEYALQTINNCTENSSGQLFAICPELNVGHQALMGVYGGVEIVASGAYKQWIFRTRETQGNAATFTNTVFLITSSNCLDGEECGGSPMNIESLSAVPLPGALWMFLSGLGALGGTKIFRQRYTRKAIRSLVMTYTKGTPRWFVCPSRKIKER